MDKVIMKYNPAFLSPEELVASFVVRHRELETIMRIIKENMTKSNQHILVIGPRGIGKTMLVLRVVEDVRKDAELQEKWYPLVFGEESYQVSTPGEFWLEALFHLAHKTGQERWKRTYEELRGERDEDRLRERALAQLMDFADAVGKRILLVVENFNMLLGEQINDSDAWKLRHTLLHEPRVMLLATATSRFEEIDNAEKAMFELFKLQDLHPLDEGECGALWASVSGKEVSDERVRPLQILTGGNPRLLAIISTFAARMSLKELMDDLMQLVDDNTEYFKSHLDNLPAVERKVYLALAELWDPVTARKVADFARLNVNKASSLLRRLIERGMVVEADGEGRAKLYQVAERMYNIYYLMRRRGGASDRVKAVVGFMVPFYGPEEMVSLAQRIAEEACGLAPTERTDHYMTYEGVISEIRDEPVAYRIIRNTPRDFFESPNVPVLLKELFENIGRTELIKRVLKVLKKSESIRNDPKQLEEKEKYFRDFVRDHPNDYTGWAALGTFLHNCTNRFEEAEKAHREAIRIDPKQTLAWSLLGYLLADNGRFEEAEQTLREGVKLNPRDENTWQALGVLLGRYLGRYGDAEYALQKAVELAPNNGGFWNNLGLALEGSGKFEEAEKAFREAIRLEKKEPVYILANLGTLLLCQNRFEEGEKHLREALKQDPSFYTVAGALVVLLINDDSRRDEGWEILKGLVRNPEIPKKDVNFSTKLFVWIAATGYEREAFGILKESPWAEALEPVVVALRLCLGEDVKAAAEIMEVGKDVVKRIEQRRAEVQGERSSEK